MLPPGELLRIRRQDRETNGQTDGGETVTLRFLLDPAGVMID